MERGLRILAAVLMTVEAAMLVDHYLVDGQGRLWLIAQPQRIRSRRKAQAEMRQAQAEVVFEAITVVGAAAGEES